MKPSKQQVLSAILLAALVVGSLELILRALTFASPPVDRLLASTAIAQTVPDDRLGHRPNPAHPEHDRQGFRNLEVPSRAHLVALGDSQTYGVA